MSTSSGVFRIRDYSNPISHRNRVVVLVTPFYRGLTSSPNRTGDLVAQIAHGLIDRGIRSHVFIPHSTELDQLRWSPVANHNNYAVNYVRVDDVSVFSIKTLGNSESDYQRATAFGQAFGHMVTVCKRYIDPLAILHVFDSRLGVAIREISTLEPGKTLFFTPMEYDHWFHRPSQTSLRGIEEGIDSADMTVLWSEAYLRAMIINNEFPPAHRDCQDPRIVKLPGTWDISEGLLPAETLTGLERFYMARLNGTGLARSIHFTRNPEMTIDRVAYLVAEPLDSSKPSRTIPITTAIRGSRDDLAKIASSIMVGGTGREEITETLAGSFAKRELTNDYYGNTGSFVNLMRMLGQLDEKGRYLIIPDCGYFERGGALTYSQNVGGLKGLTPEGNYTLGTSCIRQAPVFFRQLPNHGLGWVVWSACDNLWMPDGSPKVGEKKLWEANQGIILTAPEIPYSDNLALSSFGWFLTDRKGDVTIFAEKTKDEVAKAIIKRNGAPSVLKNTFVFAMRVEVAKRLAELLERPSIKYPSKPIFSVYPIDISSNVFCPMTLELNEWMEIFDAMSVLRSGGLPEPRPTHNGLDATEAARGMLALEAKDEGQVFDNAEDWEAIWRIADEVKRLAKGIGGANIGAKCQWDDCGSLQAIMDLWMKYISPDTGLRDIYRARAGLPISENISEVEGLEYVRFIDPVTKAVLKTPPPNVLISNVKFEGPVTIEAKDVVIVNSRLGKGVKYIPAGTIINVSSINSLEEGEGQPSETAIKPRFIYAVTADKLVSYGGFFHTSLGFQYTDPSVLAPLGLRNSDKMVALSPICIKSLKKPLIADPNYTLLRQHPALAPLETCDIGTVQKKHFEKLGVDVETLWADLTAAGYINTVGEIQGGFIQSYHHFHLDGSRYNDKQKKAIFAILDKRLKPLSDKSFVVQDPATGTPKLLGLNWLKVRGGY